MAVGKLTLPFSSHHMLSSEYMDRAGFFFGGNGGFQGLRLTWDDWKVHYVRF